MGLDTFQGILRSPQKPQLCYPCARNEVSPFSQEGQLLRRQAREFDVQGRRDSEPPIYPAPRYCLRQSEVRKETRSCSERYGFEFLPLRHPTPFRASGGAPLQIHAPLGAWV